MCATRRVDPRVYSLYPCPFCGGSARLHEHFDYTYNDPYGYSLECEGCGLCLDTHDTAEDAIGEWNTRAPTEQETVLACQLELAQARVRELESWLAKTAIIGTWNYADHITKLAQALKHKDSG